jgi:hypothetical protein
METEIEKYNACDPAVEFRKQFDSFEDAWDNCIILKRIEI